MNSEYIPLLRNYINLIHLYINKDDMIKFKQDDIEGFKTHIYNKFSFFKDNFPYLLNLLISNNDLTILNIMLNNIERVDTSNDKENELKNVRNEMAHLLNDKFVKPHLKK